jgi:hypothetical protein
MAKIWLCGITQNQKENIDELTKDVYSHFDGLIFVDHYSTDGTYEILQERKGAGKIIQRDWVNEHSHSMNEFLFSGVIEEGDWFVLRDSSERLNPEFASRIKDVVWEFDSKGIQTVFQRCKLLMARYNYDMFFLGSPHWGIHNYGQKVIVLGNGENAEQEDLTYAYSTRNGNRTKDYWINHDIKYYYVYGRSNQMALVYKEQNLINYHESRRRIFRNRCIFLGLQFTMDSLVKYIKTTPKVDEIIFDVIKENILLRNFYRYHRLGQSAEEIYKQDITL